MPCTHRKTIHPHNNCAYLLYAQEDSLSVHARRWVTPARGREANAFSRDVSLYSFNTLPCQERTSADIACYNARIHNPLATSHTAHHRHHHHQHRWHIYSNYTPRKARWVGVDGRYRNASLQRKCILYVDFIGERVFSKWPNFISTPTPHAHKRRI